MTRPWSFRSRLLSGVIAWSLGLLVLSSIAMVVVIEHHKGAPGAVHAALKQPAMAVAAVVCILIGLAQVRRALSGLDRIGEQLTAMHDVGAPRLTGAFPSEVEPLVGGLNRLLDQREQAVTRALESAGTLAHGLKTPLSVMAVDADRLDAAGQPEIAASIRQQVERMQRQVEYQLVRARAISSPAPGTRASVRDSVEGLVRALARLHGSRDLAIDVRVDPGCHVQVRREDLDEMLGNLLDNACRFARVAITIDAVTAPSGIVVTIDDDGPGIEAGLRDAVLQRGVRADESGRGHGLGLAIVRDVAELYGGAITLTPSPLGGLRATLLLPRAPDSHAT